MRDAPALNIIHELNRLGAKVKAYDPIVSQNGISHGLSGVIIETNVEMLADGCDALVLVTDWQEFLKLDFNIIKKSLKTPLIIDGRNFLDRDAIEQADIRYVGIGR